MSFYGRSFIFNGIPSEMYGLYVMNIDSSGINQSMASNSREIIEQKIYRKPVPYFYGSTPSPKLSFSFSAFSEREMDGEIFARASDWLFSPRGYKEFQIDQPDMQDVVFYAMLQNPQVSKVGNLIQGFSCEVLCNAPYAFKYPITTTYSYTGDVTNSDSIYVNLSDDSDDYLYPTEMVVTITNVGGGFSITNSDDNNRVVSFTGLSASEVLTISPYLQTISSSTGLKRLSNSNYKFLRLVPGENHLNVQGNVESISMTNQWIVKKIGG